jgi:hypothetical protein
VRWKQKTAKRKTGEHGDMNEEIFRTWLKKFLDILHKFQLENMMLHTNLSNYLDKMMRDTFIQ